MRNPCRLRPEKFFSPLLLLLLAALVAQPQLAYGAARQGLALWWQVVAPALLPFFLLSGLLLEFGVNTWLGPALGRLMGPLFALPGAAALAVAMGFCSGFPTGAAITASLRQQGQISREQGERLLAFCNNAGPLYVSVSVATGMLGWPGAALILAAAHYGTDILLGLALGGLARARGRETAAALPLESQPPLPRGLGGLGRALKRSARQGAENILLIGCYMVFFSVLTAMLEPLLARLPELGQGLLLGLFEMSLGISRLAAHSQGLAHLLPWIAALLSFGGLSVHSQVLAMTADTDLRPGCYFACRLLQAVLSWLLARWLCGVLTLPALSPAPTVVAAAAPGAAWLLALASGGGLLALGLGLRPRLSSDGGRWDNTNRC